MVIKKIYISPITILVFLIICGGLYFIINANSFRTQFEITDDLGGNLFPSAILSVASTDAQVIVPVDSMFLGNPKSIIGIRIKSKGANSRVRIELDQTNFYSQSVSEFLLDKANTEYTIYPDVNWNYENLKNNIQAVPVSVVAKVELNEKSLGQRMRTFSVRSINECLLGYYTAG